jgi:hypothetical protein
VSNFTIYNQQSFMFGQPYEIFGAISNPPTDLATGLTLALGAAAGYTGDVIDWYLVLNGGGYLAATLNYSIGGLPGGTQTGSIADGVILTAGSFTVGSPGTITPTLNISSGGNSGMTTTVTPTSFTASALPSGGITLSQLQETLASGITTLDLTQAIPASNTAQTLGDALNAARAQGFGKWVLSGTTLTIYAADNTTVVRTFTLDSATAPTMRS